MPRHKSEKADVSITMSRTSCAKSVPVNSRVRMIVLPIELVVFQRIDSREALALQIARQSTTVKSPLA